MSGSLRLVVRGYAMDRCGGFARWSAFVLVMPGGG